MLGTKIMGGSEKHQTPWWTEEMKNARRGKLKTNEVKRTPQKNVWKNV